MPGVGEAAPVGALTLTRVPVHEGHAVCQPPVGERQTRTGGCAQRGGDARNDRAGNIVCREHLELLTAAAEHKGVAAFEPCDALTGERVAQQQVVDVLLLSALPRNLADENPLRVTACTLEYLWAHQTIVKDYVGLLQQLQRPQREEVRVAGSRADEVHLAGAAARRVQL